MDNYNAIADNYNEFEQNAITLWRLGYPVVKDLLGDVNGKSVLDYGCGTGTFSRFLWANGASVTGVDVSGYPVTVIIKSEPPILLHDYFWPIEEYHKLLSETGFKTHVLREDIADRDDVNWLDERKHPPYYVIVAER